MLTVKWQRFMLAKDGKGILILFYKLVTLICTAEANADSNVVNLRLAV